MSDIKVTAARQEQSKADKRSVLDLLKNKRRKTRDLNISVNGEQITLKFQAISQSELDKLRSKHPPTAEQRAQNLGVNIRTFAPALVAACLIDPVMSEDDAREIWASDYWSAGELEQLYDTASQVCLEGMDIPSNASA